jgi:pyrroline-5-carboxylate reductase
MAEIGFIGAGNMAEAIIGGIVKKGLYEPEKISVYDVRPERMEELGSVYGVGMAASIEDLAGACPVVVLAVKPDKIPAVLGQAKDDLAGRLVISIAAGVPIQKIQSFIGSDARIVRVMPNTPALVLEGASALCASPSCTKDDVDTALAVFSAIGRCVPVDEGMMNAVTALSGSGPAFCFLFLEALADGAVRAGLPRDLALELAAATLKGAAAMVLQTGKHPGALKDMVSSPGGTTIEGIAVLEAKGFRSAAMEAVFAAFQKANKLSS